VHLAIIKQHTTSTWHKTNSGKYGVYLFILILISLTPKGKVSTEGKAYRRVSILKDKATISWIRQILKVPEV